MNVLRKISLFNPLCMANRYEIFDALYLIIKDFIKETGYVNSPWQEMFVFVSPALQKYAHIMKRHDGFLCISRKRRAKKFNNAYFYIDNKTWNENDIMIQVKQDNGYVRYKTFDIRNYI
jgi:hypothetical protein